MNTKHFKSIALCASTLLGATALLASTAQAVPSLQLDIAGGTYDNSTQTINATNSIFTLRALLTPQTNDDTAALLNDIYYISAAITPQLDSSADFNLGSFTIDGTLINVTDESLRYGAPPLHDLDGGISDSGDLQYKAGDLQSHGIFDAFYTEIAFKFSSNEKATTYNTQEHYTTTNYPNGFVVNPNGESYYAEFSINTSNVNNPYAVHFDLYETEPVYDDIYSRQNECMKRDANDNCIRWKTTRVLTGQQVVDIDVNKFAPFSHDAQSTPVPEPATMLLFGTGLVGLAGALRRRKKS